MLRPPSSVLLLTKDQIVQRKIFSVASSASIQLTIKAEYDKEVQSDVVICDLTFAKKVKADKENIVILKPKESAMLKLIEDGYCRFLFDIDNKAEVLSCLMYSGKEVDVFEAGDYVIDFTEKRMYRGSDELYISKGEFRYLIRRFVDRAGYQDSTSRVHLFRLRKRFGKDFLNNVGVRHGIENCSASVE